MKNRFLDVHGVVGNVFVFLWVGRLECQIVYIYPEEMVDVHVSEEMPDDRVLVSDGNLAVAEMLRRQASG